MGKDKFKPCPICGKTPDIRPGCHRTEPVIIGYLHWRDHKCPFVHDFKETFIDGLNNHTYQWNSCVESFERFRDLYAGRECPICNRAVTVTSGFDDDKAALQVHVACGCTQSDSDDVSHAVNLWLDRHSGLAERITRANRQAEDIAAILPGATAKTCEIGKPDAWRVDCHAEYWCQNKKARKEFLQELLVDPAVDLTEKDGRYVCTLTIKAYDDRDIRGLVDKTPQGRATANHAYRLLVDRVERAD